MLSIVFHCYPLLSIVINVCPLLSGHYIHVPDLRQIYRKLPFTQINLGIEQFRSYRAVQSSTKHPHNTTDQVLPLGEVDVGRPVGQLEAEVGRSGPADLPEQ